MEGCRDCFESLAFEKSEIDVGVANEQLQDCFAVLRRETGFKGIAPGEPASLLSC
jgi:hypothetical protein